MTKLVLLRHGQSIWNKTNQFSGWADVDLTAQGIEEAKTAAALLQDGGFTFDIAYTSLLKRAIRTLWIVLDEMDLMWLPVVRDWRLNERHYGALQGLNKSETAAKFGEEQVHIWRRSYDIPPPKLTPADEHYPGNDPRYKQLPAEVLPLAESLKDTIERFMPYYHAEIEPKVKAGQRVLIAAHGNSLRALVKYLENISDDEISGVNIPTGIPLVYEFDNEMKVQQHYYLGDQKKLAAAMQAVANQGKKAG